MSQGENEVEHFSRMGREKDGQLIGMRMVKRKVNTIPRIEKQKDRIPLGMNPEKRNLKLITRMGNLKDCGQNGMSPEKRQEYNASKMKDSALMYGPAYRDSQSHGALDYEISTLLENDIRVIIVSPPHHPSALTYVEDGQWDGLNETLARYGEWSGVTIFDQTWETGWEDDHFFDRNHLDDEGRIEFCHRIAPIIDDIKE